MEIIEKFEKNQFYNGMKDGIGIAVAYIPFGFALGLITSRYGVSNTVSIGMSYLIYSGASQTLLLKIFSSDFNIVSSVIAAAMLNFRYVLINMPVYKSLEGYNKLTKSLVGIICTDETVAFLSIKKNKNYSYALGCNFLGYFSFCGSAILGALIGSRVPAIIVTSMSFALYGTFLSLLVTSISIDNKNIKIAIIAFLFKLLFMLVPPFNLINSSLSIALVLTLTSLVYAIIELKGDKK